MSGIVQPDAVTIASGASLSTAIAIGANYFPCVLLMPAAWTAADITFQLSLDNSTFYNVYNADGTEYTLTAPVSSSAILLPPADFSGAKYLKIRSGTAGSPVNQSGAKSLSILVKE
jgi:hypothetical protein